MMDLYIEYPAKDQASERTANDIASQYGIGTRGIRLASVFFQVHDGQYPKIAARVEQANKNGMSLTLKQL